MAAAGKEAADRSAGPRGSALLLVDALIDLVLGALLIAFPASVVEALGVPQADVAFYPSILGGVLLGIGLALLIERSRPRPGLGGLGLAGAVAINLSGALVLAGWLVLGDLELPTRGLVFLWGLVAVLVLVSAFELRNRFRASS